MRRDIRTVLGLLGCLAVSVSIPALAQDNDDDDRPAAKAATSATAKASGARRDADDDDKDKDGKRQEEVDSEKIFGFTEGSDTDEAGEKEFVTDFRGRFGKRRAVRVIRQKGADDDTPSPVTAPSTIYIPRGSYTALNNVTGFEYGITDNLEFEFGVASAYYRVRNIFELENRNNGGFDGLSSELKWRILKRGTFPIGLSVAVEPEWRRFDEVSGERINGFGLGLRLMADAALVPNQVFVAANLTYEPEASRVRGAGKFLFDEDTDTLTFKPNQWERESNLEASGALVARVAQNIFLGAELRFLTKYEGLFFREFEGRALFAGPSFYTDLSERARLKIAWSSQLAGKAADDPGHSLDLVNYERHQVRVQFSLNF